MIQRDPDLPRAALLLLLIFSVAATAQDSRPEEPSCCESRAEGDACCAGGHGAESRGDAAVTPKERWLARVAEEAARDKRNLFLSTSYADVWRERLEAFAPDSTPSEKFGTRLFLSTACLRAGEVDQAIALAEECEKMAREDLDTFGPRLPEVLLTLATAQFRAGEKSNCIARHNPESCIFPFAKGAVHVDRAGAEAARATLARLLELPDNRHRLDGVWLANLAAMALGTWPEGVPEGIRLPRALVTPEAPCGRFHERGAAWRLKRANRAGSVTIDDFTGDGLPDVVVCSIDPAMPLALFRNDGGRRFTDVTADAGLQAQIGGSNVLHADYDGDGLLDLLVLRGGNLFYDAEFPNSLLRQERPGHFTDVTKDAGVEIAGPTRAAAWADVDLDGDLDLFIGYEGGRNAQGRPLYPSRLFLNDGAGRFRDHSAAAGLAAAWPCVSAAFADVDQDGDPDLLVSNLMAGVRLFVNGGSGTFAEETQARGLGAPVAAGPIACFDADDDGDLDVLVTYSHQYKHHHTPVRLVASALLEGRILDDTQRLFENDGAGKFRDVTEARGMRRVLMAGGVAVGDVDHDGAQDVYVATGAHDMAALFPNVLLLGGPRFRDATVAAGVGHLQKGNGAAFADLDGDGDLDLFCQVGGFFPDDAFTNVVFENPGSSGRFLAVDLGAPGGNRFGVGARIRVRATLPSGPRDFYRVVGSGGTPGSGPLRAHFGLGAADSIEFVEVTWPGGTTQRVTGVAMDGVVTIQRE